MNTFVKLATQRDTNQVIALFEENLSRDNEAIYSNEFFCLDGVKAAIRRNQIIVTVCDNQVVAAARFYKRKREDIISLYQFAVDKSYRGNHLISKMLRFFYKTKIIVLCPQESSFNKYYKNTGWILETSTQGVNHWRFIP